MLECFKMLMKENINVNKMQNGITSNIFQRLQIRYVPVMVLLHNNLMEMIKFCQLIEKKS